MPDLTWYCAETSSSRRGRTPNARTVCVQLDASEDGTELGVDRLFFILNGHFEPQWIKLPQLGADRGWHRAIDTSLPAGEDFAEAGQEIALDPADHYLVNPRSTVVLFAQQPKGVKRTPTPQPSVATAAR